MLLIAVMLLLIECGQCLVTIVLNGEQSTLEFVKLDMKKLNLVGLLLVLVCNSDICLLLLGLS